MNPAIIAVIVLCICLLITVIVYFTFFFNKAVNNSTSSSPTPTVSKSSQNERGQKADKNKWNCVYTNTQELRELFCSDKTEPRTNVSIVSNLSTFNCIENTDSWKCAHTIDVKDVKEFDEIEKMF